MTSKLKEKLQTLPLTAGVYLMKDASGQIIYVGKAKNLKRRVGSYFLNTEKNLKTHNLVEHIADFDYIVVANETDAFMLENNLIKKYQPHYNILLKDGKTFPYLKINLNEDFPKLEVTRKVKNDGAKYFGPYLNGISVEQVQKIVQVAFNIRTCNKKITEDTKEMRPCLNYSLGLCLAPCAKYISKQEYSIQIQKLLRFLSGDTKEVETVLHQKMDTASQLLNYEKAIEIREMLRAINNLKNRSTTQFSKLVDQDVVGYYSTGTDAVITMMIIRAGKLMAVQNFAMIDLNDFSYVAGNFLMQYYAGKSIPKQIILPQMIDDFETLTEHLSNQSGQKIKLVITQKGNNKKLCDLASQNGKEYLEKSLGIIKTREMKTFGAITRLKEVLGLKVLPKRMECYDISNISGTNSVASMVVFLNGDVAKKQYRKFNIKTVVGADDFASMREVLSRRIAELHVSQDESFSARPDLIVVDGGKGQLSAVKSVLDELGEDIELCSLAKQDEEIFVPHLENSIRLKKSDVALQVLQRIRDESHRFAIMFHRSKRSKAMTKSILDDVKGIGKVKKKMLYDRFGNLKNMADASIEELCLAGLTKYQAEELKQILNNKKG